MNDMSQVIIPKSDQINADDFLAGPRTIMISGVDIRPGTEQPVSIHYDGDKGKPWKPCKSMSRVLVHAWGADAKAYVGRSLTLYCDPHVKWGGLEVGGIRISHMSHITGKLQLALTATKGQRKPHTVMPLTASDTSSQTVPRKTSKMWRDEIDALTTTEAVLDWLADHDGMKTHESQGARDLYAYAEAHGKKLIAAADTAVIDETIAQSRDEFSDDEPVSRDENTDDFPGDR